MYHRLDRTANTDPIQYHIHGKEHLNEWLVESVVEVDSSLVVAVAVDSNLVAAVAVDSSLVVGSAADSSPVEVVAVVQVAAEQVAAEQVAAAAQVVFEPEQPDEEVIEFSPQREKK